MNILSVLIGVCIGAIFGIAIGKCFSIGMVKKLRRKMDETDRAYLNAVSEMEDKIHKQELELTLKQRVLEHQNKKLNQIYKKQKQ